MYATLLVLLSINCNLRGIYPLCDNLAFHNTSWLKRKPSTVNRATVVS